MAGALSKVMKRFVGVAQNPASVKVSEPSDPRVKLGTVDGLPATFWKITYSPIVSVATYESSHLK